MCPGGADKMNAVGAAGVGILAGQRVFRDSLAEVLNHSGMQVVVRAGDLATFLAGVRREPCGVAILYDGIKNLTSNTADEPMEALRLLRERHPEVRPLVLGNVNTQEAVQRACDVGAWGYLPVDTSSSEAVVTAVRAVARGERLVPCLSLDQIFSAPPTRAEEPDPVRQLTPREREVLSCVTNGDDNLKIAAVLTISERTVKAHISSLYRKLGSENRAQLALLARQLGVQPRANR